MTKSKVQYTGDLPDGTRFRMRNLPERTGTVVRQSPSGTWVKWDGSRKNQVGDHEWETPNRPVVISGRAEVVIIE